jgi:hypothetical protein
MIRRKAGAGATSTKSCSIYRTGRRRIWVPFPDITEAQQAMIAAVQSNKRSSSHVMSVAKFERFFRIAAGLDVDKQDLKRYSDFINHKIYDLSGSG